MKKQFIRMKSKSILVVDERIMSNKLMDLVNKAMELEFNIGKLYIKFRDICPEDAEFWWKLVIEKNNHAVLIRSGADFFMETGLFPAEILPSFLSDLQEANNKLASLLEQYDKNPPSREDAFNIALETERLVGEIHFPRMMTKPADSRTKLFQKLNEDDKDHIERIQAYMTAKGIKESP